MINIIVYNLEGEKKKATTYYHRGKWADQCEQKKKKIMTGFTGFKGLHCFQYLKKNKIKNIYITQ